MTFLEWFSKPCDPSADVPIVLAEAAWEAGRKAIREEHAANLEGLAGNPDFDDATRRVLAKIAEAIRNKIT